jgi:hypothetical protein
VSGIGGAMFGEEPPKVAKVDRDDEIPLWVQDLYIQEYPEDFRTAAALEESGLSPVEIAKPFLSLYSPEAQKGKTHGIGFQRDAIDTRLQRFPFDTQYLTPYEIRELESALHPLIGEMLASKLVTDDQQVTLLAALALRVMLATGREFEEALKIRPLTVVAGIKPDDESTDIDIGLVLLTPDTVNKDPCRVGGFLLRAISPSYKTELKADLRGADPNSSPYFLIPDSIGVGQQLFDATRLLRDPGMALLSKHQSNIRQAAQVLLGKLNEPRFSLKKIAKTLGNTIAQQTGDSTLAWMICGQTNMSDQPRMFYTRYTQVQITDAYVKAISSISPNMFEQRPIVDWHDPGTTTGGVQRLVGARFVIPTENLNETVSSMRTFLETPPDGKATQQWLINYHAAYTSYTHLFQCFETTQRTTTSPEVPFLTWCKQEKRSGIYITINDKGSHYDDRARPVLVGKALAEQYSNFYDHLHLAPRHILGGRINKKPRLLFYKWNEFVQPVAFSPKDYERVLLYFSSLSLPANFHRAYLSRFSSFDYRLFHDEISHHLSAIHTDLSLRPVPSMIAAKRLKFGIA